ncbi:Uma2 family endonuclease [Isosphaeraceae bacterium EP7]
MAQATETRATVDDLYQVEGKAELIGGRIVRFMGTGVRPAYVASEIFVSLRLYSKARGKGLAMTDGVAFVVPELASGRESFSPDASYYEGSTPATSMKFAQGPPTLAVEVRSEGDYGPAAERAMAAKRADYFEAGTAVVWDVDPVAGLVHVFRGPSAVPDATYGRGQIAEAEPAVPGWNVAVDEVLGVQGAEG